MGRPSIIQSTAAAYGAPYLSSQDRAVLTDALTNPYLRESERQARLSALSDKATEAAAQKAQETAVAQQQTAAGESWRMMSRFGADPNRMAALARDTQITNALNTASASNAAREAAINRGIGLRAGAAATAFGQPNIAGQQTGLASSTSMAGVNAANLGYMSQLPYASFRQNAYGMAMQPQQAAIQSALGWGGIMSGDYRAGLGYSAQMAQTEASGLSGLGMLAGFGAKAFGLFADGGYVSSADGGLVRGPGTGRSDSVKAINVDTGQPYRLSNGEYILPADTVRAIGKEKLDELVRLTHTPVRSRRRVVAR